MWTRLICAAALGAAAASASAETLWEFSYTGFHNREANVFDPTLRFSGAFSGTDADSNGELDITELTHFSWDNRLYVDRGGRPCGASQCELNGFTYDLRLGQLNFSSHWAYEDEASRSSGSTQAGAQLSYFGYTPGGSVSSHYLWTPATQFAINPPPIPEPAAIWLLGAGLATVAACAGRGRPRRQGGPTKRC
ncbi:hypothetical protein [Pseudoduganella chitinolytica]|uniref:PEP-CTERM sorting domain-containing protein n=1 Tax=Pseudoduganella chitinolytica TaxID=34070 RepID=A0ABY8BHX7_9BURK|nr:hypothetical protein [Pseudoduganella chitinolytica]WEF35532.1 hypothetical protein PX653_12520 [Pseudoduganella chitinolytica]